MPYRASLNLKSDEAHKLARQLAERTGESMTAAVIKAMQERLNRLQRGSEAQFVEPILAILREEPDMGNFAAALASADICRISAATFLETAIVVDANRSPPLSRRLDDLVRETAIVIEPVTSEQAQVAREAYRDYGRGSGHPARLNFGDCFAYALARAAGEPLLFKGNDFSHTDIEPALKIAEPK